MTGTDEGTEFNAVIGTGGVVRVPEEILRTLHGDGRVRVRLTPIVIADELERRNVTHDEVERIAALQLESRTQVIAFLLAEGALAPGTAKAVRKKGRKR